MPETFLEENSLTRLSCSAVQVDPEAPLVRSPWENDTSAAFLRIGYVKTEIVSWSPRVIHLHNFLSEEECDKLIDIAKPQLDGSTVVDSSTGGSVKSRARTSSGMFLSHTDQWDPLITALEQRIAAYSLVPPLNGELIQVLRYQEEQEYQPHPDYFFDEANLKRGGQRVATMLMYLTTPLEGGETIFPLAGKGECQCGKERTRGISIAPVRGNAVLFWSTKLDGQVDSDSLHGGCPVVRGEKWSATKWLRQGVFT